VALSELAVVASAGSGTPKASKPAVFDALNGLVVRVTFSGTPTAAVGCGDNQVSVPQGSPVQIEQLAPSAGGWVVSQSAQLVSGQAGAHVSLAGSSIVGAGATFAVTNPGSGQVGSLALGNSYSSGEGSPPFDPSAGTCDRSSKAWPAIFARKARAIRKQTAASFTELANLACSGATTDALSRPFKEQVSQLDSLYAFDPRFATITIGGTDLGFSGVLFDCFTGNCVQDGLLKRTDRKLEAFAPTLWHTYKKLVGNVSSVIVVGYPNIFPTTQAKSCPWLQPDERRQLNLLAKKLDTVTRNAVSVARRKFGRSRGFRISYASTLNAFAGHELCTRESWVYPLGPSGGNNRGHPTAGGQRAMAKAVVPALRRVL
jgi:lysophospholipase L1-like esterase